MRSIRRFVQKWLESTPLTFSCFTVGVVTNSAATNNRLIHTEKEETYTLQLY